MLVHNRRYEQGLCVPSTVLTSIMHKRGELLRKGMGVMNADDTSRMLVNYLLAYKTIHPLYILGKCISQAPVSNGFQEA